MKRKRTDSESDMRKSKRRKLSPSSSDQSSSLDSSSLDSPSPSLSSIQSIRSKLRSYNALIEKLQETRTRLVDQEVSVKARDETLRSLAAEDERKTQEATIVATKLEQRYFATGSEHEKAIRTNLALEKRYVQMLAAFRKSKAVLEERNERNAQLKYRVNLGLAAVMGAMFGFVEKAGLEVKVGCEAQFLSGLRSRWSTIPTSVKPELCLLCSTELRLGRYQFLLAPVLNPNAQVKVLYIPVSELGLTSHPGVLVIDPITAARFMDNVMQEMRGRTGTGVESTTISV